jgi:NhaP-type Na+/H+ or K+/H+ antiporter
MAHTILGIGVALLAASLFIVLFRRTHIPDVLLLIGLGLLLGPIAGYVSPVDFGRVGAAASTIALTIILFESGVSLPLDALGRAARLTSVLTLAAFLTAAVCVATVAAAALGLSWALAFATGAIVAGTSSAVVIPLIKQLQMSEVATTALAMESALTDVLCIVLTIAGLQAVVAGAADVGGITSAIVFSFATAAAVGVAAALALLFLVNEVRALPNPALVLVAVVLLTYGVAETLGASGAIASLTLGFTLANRKTLRITSLRGFTHTGGISQPEYGPTSSTISSSC